MPSVGRKRQFVRVDYPQGQPVHVFKKNGGKEIEGLSYDKTNETYYKRDGKRKVNLGRDLAKAIEAVQDECDIPVPVHVTFKLPESSSLNEMVSESDEWRARIRGAQHILFSEKGLPVASKEKLSDCLRSWLAWKQDEGIGKDYMDETERIFREFIGLVGDKPVSQLAKQDFVRLEKHLIKNSKSNNWWNLRIKSVNTILDFCYQKTDFPFPADLQRWRSLIGNKPVMPKKENKKPLPLDIYRGIIDHLESQARLNVDAMPKASQSDKAKRKQAWDDKREAVMFLGLIDMAINCSLDNADIGRLQWRHLKFDAKIPHMDFSRRKPERKTGAPVERLTPLLLQTIKALKRWRAYEKPSTLVFSNSQKGAWVQDKLNTAFVKLKKAAGYGSFWTFKHLKNVAPSLRKKHRLDSEMSDAILGHIPKGSKTSKFYEDDVDESYLLPLVELVDNHFFGGK